MCILKMQRQTRTRNDNAIIIIKYVIYHDIVSGIFVI